MNKIFIIALLAAIAIVNASDSKYPEDDSTTESHMPPQQRISLLSSENAALEIELDDAKTQITELMEQIHAKRLVIKALRAQNALVADINHYHGKNSMIVKTREEENADDASLALSLSALDLNPDSEGTTVPMLAAGAPEDFREINEHQRLLELHDILASKVTQSEEIINNLNAKLTAMLEDIDLLIATINTLQSATTKEQKDAYLANLPRRLGINKLT